MTHRRDKARKHNARNLIEHSDACPDCDADLGLTSSQPGLILLEVRHDETCPAYRGMTA